MAVLVVSERGWYLGVKKEETCEVCKGGMVKGLWWVDGEGIAKMTWEGVDESCCEIVGKEVGFIIPGEDVGNLGGNVVADTEDLNGEVIRYLRGCPKGGS